MKDQDKTKAQLISELEELRGRVAVSEDGDPERGRTEEELRRSEAKWRSLVNKMPLFTAVLDRSGRIAVHNDRYQPGYTPESVLGRVIYDFIQPEYHQIARECLERVFDTGETTFYESVGAGPNGTLASYEVHISPIIVNDEIVSAALISRETTDRKQAEEALRYFSGRGRSEDHVRSPGPSC